MKSAKPLSLTPSSCPEHNGKVFGLELYGHQHISFSLQSLNSLPIQLRTYFKTLLFVFKSLNDFKLLLPPYHSLHALISTYELLVAFDG